MFGIKSKKNKNAWFKPVRGSYLPIKWQGWVSYVPMILFLVGASLAVDRNSHSVSDTLYGVFPYFVCTAVVMHWVASHKS